MGRPVGEADLRQSRTSAPRGGRRPASRTGNATLSRAVSEAMRLKDWKTNPIRSRRRRVNGLLLECAEVDPATITLPSVGRSRPAAQCSRVDLPDPDGPMIAVNVPAAKPRLTALSAVTAWWRMPYTLHTDQSCTTSSVTVAVVMQPRCPSTRAVVIDGGPSLKGMARTTAAGCRCRYRRCVQFRSAWQAVTTRPGRFLRSAWPWRSLAYLLTGAVLGPVTLAGLAVLITVGTVLIVVGVGLFTLPALVLSGTVVARIERGRLRLVETEPAADPHRRPERSGRWAWVLTRLREPATWREFGYAMLSAFALWVIDAFVIGVALGPPVVAMLAPAIGQPDVTGFRVISGSGCWRSRGPRTPSPRGRRPGRPWPARWSLHVRQSSAPGWSRCPGRGPGWSTRSRSSGAGSNATCTTGPSNGWSR